MQDEKATPLHEAVVKPPPKKRAKVAKEKVGTDINTMIEAIPIPAAVSTTPKTHLKVEEGPKNTEVKKRAKMNPSAPVTPELLQRLQSMDTLALTQYIQDLIDKGRASSDEFEAAQTILYRKPRVSRSWFNCLDYLTEAIQGNALDNEQGQEGEEEEEDDDEEEEGEEEDEDEDEEEEAEDPIIEQEAEEYGVS